MYDLCIKGGTVVSPAGLSRVDVFINNGKVIELKTPPIFRMNKITKQSE